MLVETLRDGTVEVAVETWVILPDERRRSPPDNVIPEADERPPVKATFNPPSKVEVAIDWTSRGPVSIVTSPEKRVLVATESPKEGAVVAIPSLESPVMTIV